MIIVLLLFITIAKQLSIPVERRWAIHTGMFVSVGTETRLDKSEPTHPLCYYQFKY